VVDTRAAIDALKSGRLGSLGIDVYEEEADLFFQDLSDRVLQDDVLARLLTFPNVVVTGHQAFFTRDALAKIAGASAVKEYLLPDSIIRHWVVTIDNLPRQKVAVQKRPIAPVSGSFAADGDELHSTLDAQNYARYQPLVAAAAKLDTQQLTAMYIRFYPLFQQAYQDLGYPNGYFNDRLVQVIDNLLATPQPAGPIMLVRPNVMYTFADPALESRSAGQKLLIRMGPDNAATIKAKLKELRAAITAAPPKR